MLTRSFKENARLKEFVLVTMTNKKPKTGTKEDRKIARDAARKEAEREVKAIFRAQARPSAEIKNVRTLSNSSLAFVRYLFNPNDKVPGFPGLSTMMPTGRVFRRSVGTLTSSAGGVVAFLLRPSARGQMSLYNACSSNWGVTYGGDSSDLRSNPLISDLSTLFTATRLVGMRVTIRAITGSNSASGTWVFALIPPDPTTAEFGLTTNRLSFYPDSQVGTGPDLWARGQASHCWLPASSNRVGGATGTTRTWSPELFWQNDESIDIYATPNIGFIAEGLPASTAVYQVVVETGYEGLPRSTLTSTYPANTNVQAAQVASMVMAHPAAVKALQQTHSSVRASDAVPNAVQNPLNGTNLLRNVMASVPGFLNTVIDNAPGVLAYLNAGEAGKVLGAGKLAGGTSRLLGAGAVAADSAEVAAMLAAASAEAA